jgi:hypothetical protein
MSDKEKEEKKQELNPIVAELVRKHTLIDRLIRLGTAGGIIWAIVWGVTTFGFKVGTMWVEYKEGMATVAVTKRTADSLMDISFKQTKEILDYQVSNNQVHVVYDKVCLRDSQLTNNERNILRNDENKNIVSR